MWSKQSSAIVVATAAGTLSACALLGNLGQFDGASDADSGVLQDAQPADREAGLNLSGDGGVEGDGDLADAPVPADGNASCAPTIVSAAVPLTGLYLSPTPSGLGGYAYSFSDGVASTVCLSSSALCAAGNTAVANAPTIWGSGFGFALDQNAAGPLNPYAVPLSASGIAYTLSNYPLQGARVTIDSGGSEYCSPLRTASGYAKWSTFNTACWDGSGVTLQGPPQDATKIQFIIPAATTAETFNLCVEAVSFVMDANPADGSDEGGLDSAATGPGGD